MKPPIFRLLANLFMVVALMGASFAMAQAEPTMNQIYSTAQAGKLDEAQVMVQQVLISHPTSAKAHFVRSELFARQGKLDLARESLASAEKFAPGLPFAKPEAVQALRSQLAGKPPVKSVASPAVTYAAPQAPVQSSNSWALPLLLAGGVMVAGYFFFRRRNPQPSAQQASYVSQNGLNGPQGFGLGGGAMQPQPAYPQAGYPQQGYPQPAGTGLGGRIMGGVATGLAVGAGVMAAEAIGRNLMGGHNNTTPQTDHSSNSFEPVPQNTDMGGSNFGISDTSSWDDGSGADAGGSSDWDN